MPPHTSGGRSCLPLCPRSSARSTMWGPCPSAKMTKSRYCSLDCWKFVISGIRSVSCICLTLLCVYKQVVRGHYKGQQIGKVVQVYRKKYVIYIERVQREKANGTTVHVGIHPSKVRQSCVDPERGVPAWIWKKVNFIIFNTVIYSMEVSRCKPIFRSQFVCTSLDSHLRDWFLCFFVMSLMWILGCHTNCSIRFLGKRIMLSLWLSKSNIRETCFTIKPSFHLFY